jgi:DnaJ-class molecular chaperone
MRTIISEGRGIEFLRLHFDCNVPVAFDDVKKKFRQKSKLLHPDVGGEEEAFKALSNAFDDLKKLYEAGSRIFDAEPAEEVPEGETKPPSMPRETVDGTALSELGLGLGPTTNGRECFHCKQRGYTITKEYGKGPCRSCSGTGGEPREFSCRPCRGSGRVRQARTGEEVSCRLCFGTGKFKHPLLKDCVHCYGTGESRTGAERVKRIYALKCYDCKGTGEIQVLNPVLPKGRLFFVGKPQTSEEIDLPPQPTKQPSKAGKDRLFGESDPNRLHNLLDELRARGVGGKL